jgi:6-phosphogluconolactonase
LHANAQKSVSVEFPASQCTPTEKQPRGFRIDPTGRFMVVSGEKSDTLSAYSIDPSSGALKLIGKYPTGKGSNWVEIVSVD